MTPERWKQIEAVFENALDVSTAERTAFLEQTCKDDKELRREVESLLNAHGQAYSLLEHQSLFVLDEAMEEDRVALSEGELIGHYRIISLLGRGGMGDVYRARDANLGRDVALKVLPTRFSSDTQRLRRFVQEAKSASALNHPNILTIHEIGLADTTRFIVTEFVEGDTLRDKIHRDKIDLKRLLGYLTQVADGLAKAHAAGIVHRDLKPDNVMITHDGFAKILDFGLAKLIQLPEAPGAVAATLSQSSAALPGQRSATGIVMGTVGYMSPEQAQSKPVDQRSDIFSFGCVLYEAATGRKPFEGDSFIDTLHKIIHEPAPSLKDLNPLAPAGLEQIVNKCLAKHPEERYQLIKETAADLREVQHATAEPRYPIGHASGEIAATRKTERSAVGSTQVATLNDSSQSVREPLSSAEYIVSEIKRHRQAAIAACVALVVVVAGLTYFYFARTNKTAIDSLAVLPFANVGEDPNMAYLSDGITESLINSLSHVRDLRMIAFGSVVRYRGSDTDARTVGQQLGVQAVLTGRVVQRGDSLVISAELLNTRDGSHIWGEQYNRKMTDLLTLQQEIARDVSQKLRERLSGTDQQRVAKNYTENAEAYQLYLKGRYHMVRLTPSENQRAISYFRQAIELDPSYALAYVGLADAYRALPISADVPSTELFPKAKATVQKALEIDEGLAEAHAVLGFTIFWYEWNWNEAENQYKRALELNPNGLNTHLYYAHLLSETGRHKEGLTEIKRALVLDPLSIYANALEAQFLLHAGQVDDALAQLQKAFELAPDYWLAHLFASSAYIEKGMYKEAVAEAQKSMDKMPESSHATAFFAYALAKSGKRAEATRVLEVLLKSSNQRFVPPYTIALVYNGLGERDQSLAWLEKGYQQRDPRMVFLKVEPKWNDLRSDPRFQDLLRRVGLS